jgi:hypothetical protein
VAVGDIGFEDSDDLVVGFIAVNHPQAADGQGADEEVACAAGRSVSTQMSKGSPSPLMPSRPTRVSQSSAICSPQKVCG